jgi:hypothetical protein
MEDANKIKKYEEMYRITCDGLNRLVDSSSNLDDKATKYLSALGIVLTVMGFGVSSILKPGFVIVGVLDGICFFLLVVLFSLFLLAAFVFMTVLSIRKHSIMPVSDELIEIFTDDKHEYLKVLLTMSKGNVKAFEKNDKILKEKIQKINIGESIIIFGMFLAGVFMFFVCMKIIFP